MCVQKVMEWAQVKMIPGENLKGSQWLNLR